MVDSCPKCGATIVDGSTAEGCDWCTAIFEDEAIECEHCSDEIDLGDVTTSDSALGRIQTHLEENHV